MLDLLKEDDSYLYGFLLADGSLSLSTRNRGKIVVELKDIDENILLEFHELYEGSIRYRERKTNFSNYIRTCIWTNTKIEFRSSLIELGFPIKDKSLLANVPNGPHSEKDFWRGYVDGNGSFGLTSKNIPFLVLGTKSESLRNKWIELLGSRGIVVNTQKNARDNYYNITIYTEDCQKISDFLYSSDCLRMDRKYEKYLEVMDWKRPEEMKKIFSKKWDKEQDKFILSHSIEESMDFLQRTKKSITIRLFRLSHDVSY